MKTLFYSINGILSTCFYFLNTVFWFIPIMVASFFKLIPLKQWQTWMSSIADKSASAWISVNRINQNIFSRTQYTLRKDPLLGPNSWYLVIANHQSWVDILVLQRVFNRKIPFLKFFLKQNLIFVPFLGLAWWGLDFPFMKRYSKAAIAKDPSLKGKDLETTKRACQKYENSPVSIMNFVEGTRFNKDKANSTYTQRLALKHTLAPKTGGIAYVLSAMGDRLSKLVDVTIFYPQGIPSYWDFVCGKVENIVVDINVTDINTLLNEKTFSSQYFTEPAQKQIFQDWLNTVWKQKDDMIEAIQKETL